MSIAKLEITQKSRKIWTCGKCRQEIPKGEKVIHYAVGFRGYPQHRCGKPQCFPKPSERESSLVSTVYAAQEDCNPGDLLDLDDIRAAVESVADACDEVADEYENNEMFEINPDLQERAEQVRSAGDELREWENDLPEEPDEDDEDSWGEEDNFEDAHAAWINEVSDAAQSAVDGMDLP